MNSLPQLAYLFSGSSEIKPPCLLILYPVCASPSPCCLLYSYATQVLYLHVPCIMENSLSESFLFKGSVRDSFLSGPRVSLFQHLLNGQQPIQLILASLCFTEHLIPLISIYMISQCSSFAVKSKPFQRT